MLPNTSRTLFVGREREIDLYQRLLKQEQPWLLIVAGMAGNGKSKLLHYLREHSPSDVFVIRLDFANKTLQFEPLKVLEEISFKTEEYCDPEATNTFLDTLQSIRDKLSHRNLENVLRYQDAKAAHHSDNELLFDLRYLAVEERKQEHALIAQAQTALYAQLATYRQGHLVILFDTCEWLNNPQGQESVRWFKDNLLPGIHAHIQGPCHIVLASRTSPQFVTIQPHEMLIHEIQPLDEAAVQLYLEHIGIVDPELQQSVYFHTKGNPLCVALFATLCIEQQQPLPLLEKSFKEQASQELIQDRLIRDQPTPFRELTRYGVLLRNFDWEILHSVFKEFLTGAEGYRYFEQFVHYSYIEEGLGQRPYALHILLRELQMENIRASEPDKWLLYHTRARQYYQKRNDSEQYYHAIALDEEAGLHEWEQAVLKAFEHASNVELEMLLQIPQDSALKLSERGQALYTYIWGLRYEHMLRWQEASERYQQALTLFRQAQDNIGEGRVLMSLGNVKISDNQHEAALREYQQALYLFQIQGDQRNEALALQALGNAVLSDRSKWGEALLYYQQALTCLRMVQDELNIARVLLDIGNVQLNAQDRWHEALQSYHEALALFQKIGDWHDAIHVLQALGDAYQKNEQWTRALNYYQQALRRYHEHTPTNMNPATRTAYLRWEADMHETIGSVQDMLLHFLVAQESYRQALALYRAANDSAGEKRILQALDRNRVLRVLEENNDLSHSLSLDFSAYQPVPRVISNLTDIIKQTGPEKSSEQTDIPNEAETKIESTETDDPRNVQSRSNTDLPIAKLPSNPYADDPYKRYPTTNPTYLIPPPLSNSYSNYPSTNPAGNKTETPDEPGKKYPQTPPLPDPRPYSPPEAMFKIPEPRPVRRIIIVVVIILLLLSILVASVWNIFSSRPSIATICLGSQAALQNIGVVQTASGCLTENIGVSDGAYVFDLALNNSDYKRVAANIQRTAENHHQHADPVIWQDAINQTPSDAEAQIYQEDLRVSADTRPHITFVVASILTPAGGDFTGGGRDILQGAYIAQKDHNDQCRQNSNNNCFLIRLLVANSGSRVEYAAFVARQIVNIAQKDNTVMGVLGWLNSSHTEQAYPILANAHIPMVSSSATSDTLTNISPYFFRVISPDRIQGQYAAKYAREELHASRVAVFYDPKDTYSNSLAKAFEQQIGSSHIVVKETYTVSSTTNDTPLDKLNDALNYRPDLIYFAGYARDISSMLVSLGKQEHTANLNVLGGDALFVPGDYTPPAQQSDFHNLLFTAFAHPDLWKENGQSNNNQPPAFFARYAQMYDPQQQQPHIYGYSLPDSNSILSYDAINVLLKGYQNAFDRQPDHSTSIKSDAVRQGLTLIDSQHPWLGANGPIAFQSDRDPASQSVAILKVNGNSAQDITIDHLYQIKS